MKAVKPYECSRVLQLNVKTSKGTRMKKWITSFVVMVAGTAGAQSNFQVDFRWLMSNHCNNTSPELHLSNLPAGTSRLAIQMIDLDNNKHDHGGGTLERPEGFPSQWRVEAGALNAYTGPCPENFTTLGHEYQFNITALGKDGKTLGTGSAKAPFSAKFVILQGVIGKP